LAYDAIWHEDSLEDLEKLDRQIAKRIKDKVKEHLLRDPLKLGTPLKGHLKGIYRYRVGSYRVIYIIDRTEHQVRIMGINHRKRVYRKRL
jgi:mRNA interferase RelE/StbE